MVAAKCFGILIEGYRGGWGSTEQLKGIAWKTLVVAIGTKLEYCKAR